MKTKAPIWLKFFAVSVVMLFFVVLLVTTVYMQQMIRKENSIVDSNISNSTYYANLSVENSLSGYSERIGSMAVAEQFYQGQENGEAEYRTAVREKLASVYSESSEILAIFSLNLDATEKVESLKARYANGVTSDLEGLELAGSAGSTLSYVAKTNYIAADGTVTRPAAGEANAYGRLSVFAKKLPSVSAEGGFMYALDSDSSQTLRLLVLATPAVSYQNFAATYADGTEIVPNALTSGATVNASVAVKKADTKDRTALLAAAVYQNGVLVKVESASAVLSEEYQPITTSVILPESEDMSGITIRVFLWDSLDCANPYADPIEY